MPTPVKRVENQAKHLSRSQRAAREAAEAELKRAARVVLRVPEWLSDDAREIWRGILRKIKGLELLDNVDSEILAVYCDALAHYRVASKLLTRLDENGLPLATDEQVKQAQAWARVVSTYAEKLGLSPNARARLAKRKAEEPPPDPMELLLADVDYFVNNDGK